MPHNPEAKNAVAATTDAPQLEIRISVNSGDMAARQALSHILDALVPLKLDIAESGTVELVLAEAINNIVEHAYGPETQGEIDLTCIHAKDGFRSPT